MEEEYRMQKAQGEPRGPSSVENGDGMANGNGSGQGQGKLAPRDADDDASTRGVVSPIESAAGDDGLEGVTNGIPTIKISSESEVEAEAETQTQAETESTVVEAESGDITSPEVPQTTTTISTSTTANGVELSLEKPSQAAASQDSAEGGEASPHVLVQEPFSFSNKRLCERWLDNLFMVLYEVRPSRHQTGA